MNAENKISSSKLKHTVLVFFLLLLFLPMIQQQFKFVKEKNLDAVDNSLETPEVSFSNYFDGKFQIEFEKPLDVNTGFRKTLIRLQNQLYYSVFNITKAGSVVIGENQYLYGKSHLFGYSGEDFVGKEAIDLQIEKIKVIEQELNKKNVLLLFAFAPGKGSYFPENIPKEYLKKYVKDSTNYSYYTLACRKAGFNLVDLRSYFLSIKDTIKHPLFSQVGVHWTDYAAFLAIDTIVKKIEEIKKIKLYDFKISSFEYRDTIKRADKDAENMMNLFCSLPAYKMAYLKIDYFKDSNSVKPNLLTISDSYFSTVVATGIVDSVFSGWSYWNYNACASSNKASKIFNLKYELEKRDVILLMATDATLGQFPYGFIDNVYELYAPKNKEYSSLKNKEFRLYVINAFKNIENNKYWKRQLIKNAKEKVISNEEEFFYNAKWLYNEKEIQNKRFIFVQ